MLVTLKMNTAMAAGKKPLWIGNGPVILMIPSNCEGVGCRVEFLILTRGEPLIAGDLEA